MRHRTLFLLLLLLSSRLKSQTDIQIQIPENYELSNIVLALTEYGRTDEWEVKKKSRYYQEVLAYFAPVKNHPLLKKANYSRKLWEDYLSFRTDAVAFSFDNDKLKRSFSFYANPGHKPFDKNLELINDFIKQSGFRRFYKDHKPLYDSIIANYSSYYMMNEMMTFLKKECGVDQSNKQEEYRIILSPLVGRMNCHRDLTDSVVADFPSLATTLTNNHDINKVDQGERALEIHMLFTEADHGFVNPISYKFEKEMKVKIDYAKWDKESGYPDINLFNEYMTWALYDLFVLKYFPAIADSISTQWHYQNGERGFFASSAFARKVVALSKTKSGGETLVDFYPKIINWCNEFQKEISLPTIVSPIEPLTIKDFSNTQVKISFSEPMIEKESFDINIISFNGEKRATTHQRLTKENNKIAWADNGKELTFTIDLGPSDKIYLQTNWWDCLTPLESKKGIMLKVASKVTLKRSDK